MVDIEKVYASCEKLLGKDGKIPDPPEAFNKASERFDKAKDAFDDARKDCEAKLLDMQNANSEQMNAFKQYRAILGKEDFGLDEKNKDEAKKIEQVKKLLTGAVDSYMTDLKKTDKELDELDKHLIQVGKYKVGR